MAGYSQHNQDSQDDEKNFLITDLLTVITYKNNPYLTEVFNTKTGEPVHGVTAIDFHWTPRTQLTVTFTIALERLHTNNTNTLQGEIRSVCPACGCFVELDRFQHMRLLHPSDASVTQLEDAHSLQTAEASQDTCLPFYPLSDTSQDVLKGV